MTPNNNLFYCLTDPVNLIDPDGLWSVSFDIYVGGKGGGITIGRDPGKNGGWFISLRHGTGVGGGLLLDPNGTSPGFDPCAPRPDFGIGFYEELILSALGVAIGLTGKAGITTTGPYADIDIL